jgi:hypothetical protein
MKNTRRGAARVDRQVKSGLVCSAGVWIRPAARNSDNLILFSGAFFGGGSRGLLDSKN